MEARAIVRNVRMTPRKIKLICENWDQWLDALTFHINTRAAIRQSYDVGRGVEQS